MGAGKAGARHIVAIGGCGFTRKRRDQLLMEFILRLTRKRKPRVCFLATAGGDGRERIAHFRRAIPKKRAEVSALRLFGREVSDVRGFLLGHDVIYVGGGSTANMLAVWRVHGVDRALRAAWRQGIVMAGVSAGMLCWYRQGVTDSFGPELAELDDGLGILSGSACPHYDGEANRRPVYERAVAGGRLSGGVAVDNDAALHYVGRSLKEAVCSRRGAGAYQVRLRGGEVVEIPLATRYLGGRRK